MKISIDVPFTELEPHINSAYKALGERITVPGFRKGKVPNAMIEQRVGRGAVLDEAINSALPVFYSNAAREHNVAVIGRPKVDITELVDREKLSLTIEVDIRPELKLPNFSEMTIEVEDVVVSDKEIDDQIDALRARFGTLTTVEKTIEKGDFVTIDLSAKIDGKEIDGGTVNDISYEVGTNRMVDGLDDALMGLNAGESKRFDTQLVGQKDGESGTVDVTVKAVKHRDLPELNDDFAKLASEFDSLSELRADITSRLERLKQLEQGSLARDILVERLLESVEIPLPEGLIEDEVHDHLEKEGRLEDDVHRKEVTESATRALREEILFDTIVQAENVSVNDAELSEYLIRSSQRYGMTPDQFVKEISDAGQINSMVAEVARAKALAGALGRVKVVTKSGKTIDLEALRPQAPVSEAESESTGESESSES
jgi:trigger factor